MINKNLHMFFSLFLRLRLQKVLTRCPSKMDPTCALLLHAPIPWQLRGEGMEHPIAPMAVLVSLAVESWGSFSVCKAIFSLPTAVHVCGYVGRRGWHFTLDTDSHIQSDPGALICYLYAVNACLKIALKRKLIGM